jgi:hypothetical protein
MFVIKVYGIGGVYELPRQSFESACVSMERMKRKVAFSSKRMEVVEL